MNYSSQEEHDYYESGAAEAQAMYEQQEAYCSFLNSLIEKKQYELHAIYIALDILDSQQFKESKQTAFDYLLNKKNTIETNTNKPTDNTNLPF